MKRILTLALAVAFTLGSVSAANAIEIKAAGTWDFAFGWADGVLESSTRSNANRERHDSFYARHRVRTQINFIASENLQGVLMFEIGNLDWGYTPDQRSYGRGSGAGLDADGVNVETKRAYLDWMIPQTDVSVRMGIQGIFLPSATDWGNPVLGSDVAGITVNVPFNDMVSLTAIWARPFNYWGDSDNGWNRSRSVADETDLFFLVLPINGDGWSLTPWGGYGRIGVGSGFYDYIGFDTNHSGTGHANAWWAGAAFNLDIIDPLAFSMDVIYGRLGTADIWDAADVKVRDMKASGWFIDAALDYRTDFATFGIYGWWSTGDDYDDLRDNEYGRLPALGFDDGVHPTSYGTPGSYNIAPDGAISATLTGTWGVGAKVEDMTFIEDLSHTLKVTYYRGTNDRDIIRNGLEPIAMSDENVYLTDKDGAIEVNFDSTYQMYDNLTLVLELGYIHLWMDDDTWNSSTSSSSRYQGGTGPNAWKGMLLFRYKF